MNLEPTKDIHRKLRKLIRDYEARGYEVLIGGDIGSVPEEVSKLEPDLIVRRGDEHVVVEFKRGDFSSRRASSDRLKTMARAIENLPNWKLELHWLGASPVRRVSRDQAYAILARAEEVYDVDPGASLLLGWSAAEVALDEMIQSIKTDYSGDISDSRLMRSPRQMVSLAQSLGLISDDIYNHLQIAVDIRNRISHGVHVGENVEVVARDFLKTVRQILPEGYASPDQMIDWFRQNYEDPAESVPYDGREGGYQYVGTGPYDARDVLQEKFPHASQRDIDEAVGELEEECSEWASKE